MYVCILCAFEIIHREKKLGRVDSKTQTVSQTDSVSCWLSVHAYTQRADCTHMRRQGRPGQSLWVNGSGDKSASARVSVFPQ